jgi:hypothetical protein
MDVPGRGRGQEIPDLHPPVASELLGKAKPVEGGIELEEGDGLGHAEQAFTGR